jgi:hypothetical protein
MTYSNVSSVNSSGGGALNRENQEAQNSGTDTFLCAWLWAECAVPAGVCPCIKYPISLCLHEKLPASLIQVPHLDKIKGGCFQPLSTVSRAGNLCWHIRISTCTVSISESVVSLLLSPVAGACRQQLSLLAQCV